MALFPYDIKQGVISGFKPFHKGIPFFAIRRMLPNKKCIDDHDYRHLDHSENKPKCEYIGYFVGIIIRNHAFQLVLVI